MMTKLGGCKQRIRAAAFHVWQYTDRLRRRDLGLTKLQRRTYREALIMAEERLRRLHIELEKLLQNQTPTK